MLRADDRHRIHSQPSLEDRRIELSEVDRRLQVPASAGLRVAEIQQRRVLTVGTALDVVPDHESDAAGTVVGAERAVHLGPTTELRVDHDSDPTAVCRRKHREELVQRVIDVHPEAGMPFDAAAVGLALVLVGVEAAGVGVDHPSPEVRSDEVRRHRELTLETRRARDDAGVGVADHGSQVERSSAEFGPVIAQSPEGRLLSHRPHGHRSTLVPTRRRRPESVPLPRRDRQRV